GPRGRAISVLSEGDATLPCTPPQKVKHSVAAPWGDGPGRLLQGEAHQGYPGPPALPFPTPSRKRTPPEGGNDPCPHRRPTPTRTPSPRPPPATAPPRVISSGGLGPAGRCAPSSGRTATPSSARCASPRWPSSRSARGSRIWSS